MRLTLNDTVERNLTAELTKNSQKLGKKPRGGKFDLTHKATFTNKKKNITWQPVESAALYYSEQ